MLGGQRKGEDKTHSRGRKNRGMKQREEERPQMDGHTVRRVADRARASDRSKGSVCVCVCFITPPSSSLLIVA